jgi:acyl-CoA oxidase
VNRLLTPRGGSGRIKHALTYFHNVHLPFNSLIGHTSKAADAKSAFFEHISRVISGTLLMGAVAVSCLRISAYIAARYSLRRQVTDSASASMVPVISFSTQATSVLTAIAEAHVLRAFGNDSHARFTDSANNGPMRHFIAAIFKVTSIRITLPTLHTLEDRCGAQGLFNVNQISALHVRL